MALCKVLRLVRLPVGLAMMIAVWDTWIPE